MEWPGLRSSPSAEIVGLKSRLQFAKSGKMSSDTDEEVSTSMDCSAFTTLGDIMPPRDPDEEESDEEEDEEDDRADEPAVVREPDED